MFFYSLDISSIVTIVLFILLAVLVAKGVRTVSQGEEWVVERLAAISGLWCRACRSSSRFLTVSLIG